MMLVSLKIDGFRNLTTPAVEFDNQTNYIFGDNGQGKTNLLEAIFVLCLAKSFRTHDDYELISFSKNYSRVEGSFLAPNDVQHRMVVGIDRNQGKQLMLDGKRISPFSKIIGRFPIVALSANDHAITNGPPGERRRFFNILLSQCHSHYLDDLKEYDRILKQRNRILSEWKSKSASSQIDAWSLALAAKGSSLMKARKAIAEEINARIHNYYQKVSNSIQPLKVIYSPNVEFDSIESIQEQFENSLHKVASKERIQGTTLVGPHRDEFIFSLYEQDLRRYGSRGEHKSVLMSLKATECELLKEKTDIDPLLLLDDLYAELDSNRAQLAMDLFSSPSQKFITGTSFDYENLRGKIEKHIYWVKNGEVVHS
jgi:DNA replication and repair protein RecF